MSRLKFLLLILLFILSAENCKKQEESYTELKDIQGKLWLHSYEEDSLEFKAYRPESFHFPPSRGRAGFKIENDSIFIQYAIAPADGWEKHFGKIKKKDNKQFLITFKKEKSSLTGIEIIEGTKDYLLIKEF